MSEITDQDREELERALAAAFNYHSFDARLGWPDYEAAAILVGTTAAATAPGGLLAAVERIAMRQRGD